MSTLEQQVIERVLHWINLADLRLGVKLPMPRIFFNVRGATAGWANSTKHTLRFNPTLLEQNPADFLSDTVPHEVAHLVADKLDPHCVHGPTWQLVMRRFGLEPTRCHNYDITHIRPYVYKCACRLFHLSTRLHNQIQAGRGRRCYACKSRLTFHHSEIKPKNQIEEC